MRPVPLALSLALTAAVGASPVSNRAVPRTATSNEWSTRSFPLTDIASRSATQESDKSKRQSWSFSQPGSTGVLAMMMAVVSPTQLLIVDRTAHNPMMVDGHNAWAAVYSLTSNTARPVRVQTNSFCAGGSWLSNGTLANIGGFSAEHADIPDQNGFQAVRYWYPEQCPDDPNGGPCSFTEFPNRIRLAKSRWYPSVVRIGDGSVLVIGGSNAAAFINSAAINVPSYEYWPPKNIAGSNGLPLTSPLLTQTLNANLFPLAFYLPAGRVFIAANTKAWMYDMNANYEIRLPDLPNGVRVNYPMTGTGILLPLTAANNWTPTILICGGSSGSDTVNSMNLTAQDPASSQCSRLELSVNGIRAGWIVEQMPEARIMPDAVLLPDGRVLIANGGRTGYAGYGNVRGQVGASNADSPVFRPIIYDPTAPLGSRFSTAGMPTSNIPRLYHSVATLLPSGAVAIAGSNPNGDFTTQGTYPTEYRLEILSPPYMSQTRPIIGTVPRTANWGTTLTLTATLPPGTTTLTAALIDLGFSTHSVHMDMRHVWLSCSIVSPTQITITMPPNFTIFPPGPGWLYVLADGVPSVGQRILIGTGAGPRVDVAAWNNMLANTGNPT